MRKHGFNEIWVVGAAALALAACGGGNSDGSNGTTGSSSAPQNNRPVIGGSPSTTATAGTMWSFQPSASDADGDALSFSATGLPGWASINETTGRVSGVPQEADVGSTGSIVVRVSDGQVSAALPSFSITIESAATSTPPPPPPGNQAPVISGTPATSVTEGSFYSFRPTASDPNGQTVTFSIQNKPSWATFSSVTGRVYGTPQSVDAGKTTSGIVITASDGSLTASLPAFSITVNAKPNTPPAISGSPALNVTAGSSYSFTPTASDADGDTLFFTITNKPAWVQFSSSTGAMTGTAVAGTYAGIVITVTDGKASVSLPAFTIVVTATGGTGKATLSWQAPTQYTDGSAILPAELSGYLVYHGTAANALDDVIPVSGGSTLSYVVDGLISGTHYFAVTAVTASGNESVQTSVRSVNIQ
jgi:hypothetical protein